MLSRNLHHSICKPSLKYSTSIFHSICVLKRGAGVTSLGHIYISLGPISHFTAEWQRPFIAGPLHFEKNLHASPVYYQNLISRLGPGPNSRLGHSQAISARLLTEEQGI
ncbi:hypothetical protein CEXT_523541 [Caerostris extrusa]|uniref:Uncharacterized protein n=1 Tax=Caerostris extrusa TaxID=172846 RepID=A0AAV4T2E3_CAEEX|nr:hypothetical protein CEXT_523541 [Caerostris extrusa]